MVQSQQMKKFTPSRDTGHDSPQRQKGNTMNTTRHITTHSIKEAWNLADELFPCDYLHDSSRTQRAGYDIYMSTNPEVYAWISDLGDRLELNMADGSTINLWIVPEGEIAEEDMNAAICEAVQAEMDAEAVTLAAPEQGCVWDENGKEVKPEEEPALPENWEARKELGRRIQRLMYHYTIEYMDEMERKAEEDKAIEEMKNNPDGGMKCLVLTAEWNAKVMMDCMKDCRRAVKILANKSEDVDDWMIAGANAAITEATKDAYIPFDLPTCLCGLLGAEFRDCLKK